MHRIVFFLIGGVGIAGTLVGHPVNTGFAAGTGLVYDEGALAVSTTVHDKCDGTYQTNDVDDTIDPVAGDPLALPVGSNCAVRINLSAPVVLEGHGTSGGTFDLELNVGHIDIVIDPPIFVPTGGGSGGTLIRLAEADWISADLLDLEPGQHVHVGPTHNLHTQLRNAVRAASEAW